jgi:hypothetical protein
MLHAAHSALAQPAAEDPLGKDVKLDRKVQISAEGIPVSDLLAAISRQTGLAFRADGVAADDKVIVFGPARPLRSVLMDIASLFNDEWRHYVNVEGKEQYALRREPKAIRYENGLADSVVAKMQAQLAQQVRALDETPEQFAKRPANDPIRENLAKPILHGRTATKLYSLLNRQQVDTLFAQGYLNVSFVSSGATAQETARGAFKEAVEGLVKENERIQQEHPDVHIVIDAPENLERNGIRFNLHHENNAGLSALVVQVIMGKASYMTMGSFNCSDQWILPAHGNPYTRARLKPDADLPKEKETVAAAKVHGWIEQLRELATKSERPVVADLFRTPPLVKPLASEEQPEERTPQSAEKGPISALDTLCHPAGYLWWVQDKTLLFRKRDWYQQQRYEVPDRWIRSVAKRLAAQKGVPSFGDLASLGELSRTQIAGLTNLLAGGGRTPTDADTLAGLPELLQIVAAAADPEAPIYVGSLSPQLVQRIALPRRGVSPAMRAPVAAFLSARRQITAPEDVDRFHVCLTCYGPLPTNDQDPPTPDPRDKVTIMVEWNPGNGQTPFDQRLDLYLPMALPDDRSSKTKVELAE